MRPGVVVFLEQGLRIKLKIDASGLVDRVSFLGERDEGESMDVTCCSLILGCCAEI
jgi:hypothetical protein